MVLVLLAEAPMHPYEMQRIMQWRGKDQVVRVQRGSLYPAVERLVKAGLVEPSEVEREGRRPERTVYRLTEEGQRVATDRAEEFASLWEGVAPSEDDTQLGDLVFQVGAAFVHVARTGSPEQMAEARKVLARTRADLYRILGEHDGRGGDQSS